MKATIFEKIEELYKDEPCGKDENLSILLGDILNELKEIKVILKNQKDPEKNIEKKDKNYEYYRFVNDFRKRLKADEINGIYPEVHYQGKRIGVNINGYLYDKETAKNLPSYEAFAVYEYFYLKKDELDNYIIKD